MIGGTTYEEARTIALFNQDPVAASNGAVTGTGGVRILLGGTCVHNSSSYDTFLTTTSRLILPKVRRDVAVRCS